MDEEPEPQQPTVPVATTVPIEKIEAPVKKRKNEKTKTKEKAKVEKVKVKPEKKEKEKKKTKKTKPKAKAASSAVAGLGVNIRFDSEFYYNLQLLLKWRRGARGVFVQVGPHQIVSRNARCHFEAYQTTHLWLSRTLSRWVQVRLKILVLIFKSKKTNFFSLEKFA